MGKTVEESKGGKDKQVRKEVVQGKREIQDGQKLHKEKRNSDSNHTRKKSENGKKEMKYQNKEIGVHIRQSLVGPSMYKKGK